MQDIIKIDHLYFKSSRRKIYNLCKYYLPIAFWRDINKWYLSLKDADDEQSKVSNKLKNIELGQKSVEKYLFLNNIWLFLTVREINS